MTRYGSIFSVPSNAIKLRHQFYQNLKIVYHRIFNMMDHKSGPGNCLVSTSALLDFEGTYAILIVFAVTASWTRWYAIELCFLLNVESGTVLLVTAN
jgi:hypothetical protein